MSPWRKAYALWAKRKARSMFSQSRSRAIIRPDPEGAEGTRQPELLLIQRDHRAAKYLEFVAGAKLDEAYNDFPDVGRIRRATGPLMISDRLYSNTRVRWTCRPPVRKISAWSPGGSRRKWT